MVVEKDLYLFICERVVVVILYFKFLMDCICDFREDEFWGSSKYFDFGYFLLFFRGSCIWGYSWRRLGC